MVLSSPGETSSVYTPSPANTSRLLNTCSRAAADPGRPGNLIRRAFRSKIHSGHELARISRHESRRADDQGIGNADDCLVLVRLVEPTSPASCRRPYPTQ